MGGVDVTQIPNQRPVVNGYSIAELQIAANVPTVGVRPLAYSRILMLNEDVVCEYKINYGIWVRITWRVNVFFTTDEPVSAVLPAPTRRIRISIRSLPPVGYRTHSYP